MAEKFDNLSEQQRNAFHAQLNKLGINPESVPSVCTTTDHPGGMIVGSSGNHCKLINVQSIAHLNQLVGAGEHDVDAIYPDCCKKNGVCELAEKHGDRDLLRSALNRDQHSAVRKAMSAYVQADSSKVSGYEKAINTLYFPIKMPVHAAKVMEVTGGNPLKILSPDGTPATLIYGSLNIQKGGYIEISCPVNMSSQKTNIE